MQAHFFGELTFGFELDLLPDFFLLGFRERTAAGHFFFFMGVEVGEKV